MKYDPVLERGIRIATYCAFGQKLTRMSKPRRTNWMKNRLCPCGSGHKFKKCCWSKMVRGSFDG